MKRAFLISLSLASTALWASARLPLTLQESDLVGEWQVSSKVLGSNKRNAYVFKANHTFVYTTDGQDALIEVLSIRGTYSLKKDTVYVQPHALTKRVGGKLSKNFYTTGNDSWEMSEGTIKTIPVAHSPQYPLIIKVISKHKILEIDGSLYYRI